MTLFLVQARTRDDEALERARFIRDGFSWPAFAFGWAWLLFHRLWLAFLTWAVLETAFILFVLPHVSIPVALCIDALARAFIGVEASRLRLAKGRGKAAFTDLVEARDREDAEAIFFARARRGEAAA